MTGKIKLARRLLASGIILLSVLLFISFLVQMEREFQSADEMAKLQAKAHLEQDQLYRKWISSHGGVYVPVSEKTPPNPYLEDLPMRDIERPDGVKLTLVNPSYMTRQVHEIKGKDILGHITSLKPIRKKNAPDEWEEFQLLHFEEDTSLNAIFEKTTIDGKSYYRYIEPLITKESCLRCHSDHAYKLGDIRGGLSISIPVDKYYSVAKANILQISKAHLVAFFISIMIVFVFYKIIVRQINALDMTNKNLLDQSEALSTQNIAYEKANKLLADRNKEYKELTERYLKQNIKLEEAKLRAEESDRLKASFLDNLSHEIRTPMNGIMGFAQMISEEVFEKENLNYYLKIIRNSSNQLLEIVDDIIEISKIETKQIKIAQEPMNVKNLLLYTSEKWISKAEEKNIRLFVNCNIEDRQQWIIGDERILFSIIDKFLSNAIKFTETGEIRTSGCIEDNRLIINVQDTGVGIPEDLQAFVFERFRKVDIGESYNFNGSGLGLSIAKGYADLLNGKITVESELGTGSSFTYEQKVEFAKVPGYFVSVLEYVEKPTQTTLS